MTGSRTLLEALQVGGPFLYYNGTLGLGRQTHRHRPEKIQALLSAWESDGVSGSLRRDLDDFSRARRVEDVVRTAATDPAWRRAFPRRWRPSGFRRDRRDAGEFLVSVARSFAVGPVPSDELVRSVRAGTELPTEP